MNRTTPLLALALLPATACAGPSAGVEDPAAAPELASPAEAAAAEGLVYIANEAAAVVSIVDPATGAVDILDLRDLGYGPNAKPHDVAVEPDGSFWYVSLIGENTVLKLDRSNEVVGSVEFERPGLLAMHPGDRWLFVGRSMAAVNPPQRIGRIDRRDMAVEEFDVFVPRPHAMAVSDDGRWVFTGSLAENTLVRVDAETGEAEITRLDASMAHAFVDFAVSPDGGILAATAEHTGKLLVFDISRPPEMVLLHTLDVGSRPWHPAFTPDGRWLWFGNLGEDRVTVVDADSWSVAGTVEGEGLAMPHGIAVSPDGGRVYISNRNSEGSYEAAPSEYGDAPPGTLVVIDAERREIVDVIEIPPYGAGAAFSGASR